MQWARLPPYVRRCARRATGWAGLAMSCGAASGPLSLASGWSSLRLRSMCARCRPRTKRRRWWRPATSRASRSGGERSATPDRNPRRGATPGRASRPAALAGVPPGSLLPRLAPHRSDGRATVAAGGARTLAGERVGGHACAPPLGARDDRRATGRAAARGGDRGGHDPNAGRGDGFVRDRSQIHCRGPAGRRRRRERAGGSVSRAAAAAPAERGARRARETRPDCRPARRHSRYRAGNSAARGSTDAQESGTSGQNRLDGTGELAFWRRERAEVEARLRQAQAALESGPDLAKTAPALKSERLDQLQRRTIDLQQALAALPQRTAEQDPQIVGLRAELATLEQDRRAELELMLKKLRDEIGIIQSRETALEEKIETPREESAAGPAEGGVAALEQKLEADRALLRGASSRRRSRPKGSRRRRVAMRASSGLRSCRASRPIRAWR